MDNNLSVLLHIMDDNFVMSLVVMKGIVDVLSTTPYKLLCDGLLLFLQLELTSLRVALLVSIRTDQRVYAITAWRFPAGRSDLIVGETISDSALGVFELARVVGWGWEGAFRSGSRKALYFILTSFD